MNLTTALHTTLLAGLSVLLFSVAGAQTPVTPTDEGTATTLMRPAVALVAHVAGNATFTDFELGQEGRVDSEMKFKQGVTIATASDAMVVLLFSSGSALTINPDTTLSIEEYLQMPIPPAAPWLNLTDQERTASKTKLRLLEGEIIGSVKQLNDQEGSSYEVDSPMGTADIHGANYELSVNLRGVETPRARFSISSGSGIFIPHSGKEQVLSTRQQLEISGTMDPDGSVTITSIQTLAMSEAQSVDMTVAAEQAQSLLGENFSVDFNPDQGGVRGGEFNVTITPTQPSPHVTPLQGYNAHPLSHRLQ